MGMRTPIDLKDLQEAIGDGKITHVSEDGLTVAATWPDGSGCNLYHKGRGLKWCFGNSNTGYEAGYAYACGYHD